MKIHPTAVIHPSVRIPEGVFVGPYAILEESISLGEGVRIGAFCHLYPGVKMGRNVEVADGAILGNTPQDLKFRGETTFVSIGENTRIREYVTVNRGTVVSGTTTIGKNCLIMAYSHVAHDCIIGNTVIIANGVQMGGHVRIGDAAVISGMTGIHQFVTIGPGAFIGGGLRVERDVLPFSKAMGEPLRWSGLNEVGLAKFGYGTASRIHLKKLYQILMQEGKDALSDYLSDGENKFSHPELVQVNLLLMEFFRYQRRGLLGRSRTRTD